VHAGHFEILNSEFHFSWQMIGGTWEACQVSFDAYLPLNIMLMNIIICNNGGKKRRRASMPVHKNSWKVMNAEF